VNAATGPLVAASPAGGWSPLGLGSSLRSGRIASRGDPERLATPNPVTRTARHAAQGWISLGFRLNSNPSDNQAIIELDVIKSGLDGNCWGSGGPARHGGWQKRAVGRAAGRAKGSLGPRLLRLGASDLSFLVAMPLLCRWEQRYTPCLSEYISLKSPWRAFILAFRLIERIGDFLVATIMRKFAKAWTSSEWVPLSAKRCATAATHSDLPTWQLGCSNRPRKARKFTYSQQTIKMIEDRVALPVRKGWRRFDVKAEVEKIEIFVGKDEILLKSSTKFRRICLYVFWLLWCCKKITMLSGKHSLTLF